MSRVPILLLVVAGAGAAGCVYYNAMWSAEQLAKEARRAEQRGSSFDARSYWARAAMKAESVVVQHPRSRWAEAALVLQGEGLAKSGACDRAAIPLGAAARVVRSEALRERAALALAECTLAGNAPATAARQVADVTTSSDAGRRSQAALLTGRAAELSGDYSAAAEWYARSAAPAAAPARARVLLAAGRAPEAVALLDTLARRRVREGDWGPLLDEVAHWAGPDTASRTLDELLAQEGRRLPTGARGRLLLADGDRLFTAGRAPAAGARYAQVVALMPDSLEGLEARVRALRMLATQADSVADLVAVRARLGTLVQSGATADARALDALFRHVLDVEDVQEGGQFRTAELVRDSLGAPHLAGRLFVDFARAHPASPFAAKALVAALALLPDARDSLVAALDSRYPASPYTLALRGGDSPAFAAAEDFLAQSLGVEGEALRELPPVARVAPPVPGPRGPTLDPAPSRMSQAGSPAPPRAGARPRPRQGDDEPPHRPRPAGQPGSPPRDSL